MTRIVTRGGRLAAWLAVGTTLAWAGQAWAEPLVSRLAPEGPFESTAATGDASRATAFKGERILAARVDDMVAVITRRWPDLSATPAKS